MQNKEEEWESSELEEFKDISSDSDYGENNRYIRTIKFINKMREKAYQKGKEEGLGKNLSTTKSITETIQIPTHIIYEIEKRTRLQTLEEVERVIKEKASLKTEDKVVDIAILLFSEDILQQLNKMKDVDNSTNL